METEELTKLVDGIYKNILDKFNPGARQMINAGKAYLKALHGAAAASRLYVDAITKLARQAQQGTWGGSSDIGTALMRIVEVYKEIQEQQMNILKAFYVDLLVPLETNLEKDTKVVQSEQKRFLQQHKARSESYSKAAAAIKKQRKKTRAAAGNKAALAIDKELKNMQVLEEEKSKLDVFCEQSLKNAMTQERRRYGFVLERQCSLAKHYLSYHTNGMAIYQQNIDDWSEVAKTREYLPEAVENMFTSRMRQVSFWPDEDVYSNPRSPQLDDDRLSITSQLRKTKSMDASCLDIRSIGDASSPMLSLSRAKSEFNLTASTHSLIQDCATPQRRPKSMAVPSNQSTASHWDTQLARALYAYLSSGDNQLSFLEGDIIALMGERNKGWQFGENLRTQCSGWFPLAYTEILLDESMLSPQHHRSLESQASGALTPATPTSVGLPSLDGSTTGRGGHAPSGGGGGGGGNVDRPSSSVDNQTQSTRMFGDTLNLHRSMANAKQIRRVTGMHGSHHHHGPPPSLPAPIPTPTLPFPKSSAATMPHSQSTSFAQSTFQTPYAQPNPIKTSSSSYNFTTPAGGAYSTHPQGVRTVERAPAVPAVPLAAQTKPVTKIGAAVGNVSLHSSNDSGFSNDPPPQPEVDYSDDDLTVPTNTNRVPIRGSIHHKRSSHNDTNNNKSVNRTTTLSASHASTLSNHHSPTPPVRSNSYGTLLDNGNGRSYDQQSLQRSMRLPLTEKRGIIKRTKSFWRFGKSSDNEILEGMALWKHRDLVDIQNERNRQQRLQQQQQQQQQQQKSKEVAAPQEHSDRHSGGSSRSNDSDRTLQNAQPDPIYMEKPDPKMENGHTTSSAAPLRKASQKKPKRTDEEKKSAADSDFENHFDVNPDSEDQFFDDDGLMLRVKTVNRKNILQQYTDHDADQNTSGSESDNDTDSIITSDDPYDCIVVDDHTPSKEKPPKKVNKDTPKPNKVVEIGKKLEKLAKSTKYSPNAPKSEPNNNHVRDSNRNIERRESIPRGPRKMSENREHTFKTFGHDDQKRRSMTENRNEHHHVQQQQQQQQQQQHQQQLQQQYYAERENGDGPDAGYGDVVVPESRQIIPRTKLVKSNSVGTNNPHPAASNATDTSLLEYGQSLQKRLKNTDSKYQEISPETGNMYGPWYDLWGVDSSVKRVPKQRRPQVRDDNVYGEKF